MLRTIDELFPRGHEGDVMRSIFETFPHDVHVERVTVEKHRHIAEVGLKADSIWYVLSGRIVTVYDDPAYGPYDFDEFIPGSFLGELEVMMQKDTYIASARAMTKCVLVRIDRSVYEKWMSDETQVYKARVAALISRIMTQIDESRSAMFENIDVRLIRFLIAAAEDVRFEGDQRTIRYTREEMGNRLGCSARTINRTLNELESNGHISRKRGKVVLNPEQIQALRNRLQD